MKIDDISCSSVLSSYSGLIGYNLRYPNSLKWVKHKLDNGMISEEEYLKELLMISTSRLKSDIFYFDKNGKLIGNIP